MKFSIRWSFVLLAVSVYVLSVESVPLNKNELKNDKNCKALCSHCGCIGFYCGEECICECNSDNEEDIDCISTMQSNAKKLKIPFEILIQGPSGNRFVRDAFQFDQNQQCLKPEGRNKRSTVVIYKPGVQTLEPLLEAAKLKCERKDKNDSVMNNVPIEVETNPELEEETKSIKKRSLTWFSDSAPLLKPAPMSGLTNNLEQFGKDLMAAPSETAPTYNNPLFPTLPSLGLPNRPPASAAPSPAMPNKENEIASAADKFREAISNLRVKADQLLHSAQTAAAQEKAKMALNKLQEKIKALRQQPPKPEEIPVAQPDNSLNSLFNMPFKPWW